MLYNERQTIFEAYKAASERFRRACEEFHVMDPVTETNRVKRSYITENYIGSRQAYRTLTVLLYELDLDEQYLYWLKYGETQGMPEDEEDEP